MQIRVYYEDTDCGNMVYHSIYLNYCERARSELFFKKGLLPHSQDEFFVVKSCEANWIKSAKFADILDIKTKESIYRFPASAYQTGDNCIPHRSSTSRYGAER